MPLVLRLDGLGTDAICSYCCYVPIFNKDEVGSSNLPSSSNKKCSNFLDYLGDLDIFYCKNIKNGFFENFAKRAKTIKKEQKRQKIDVVIDVKKIKKRGAFCPPLAI